ncbi:HEAT repeat domain-containing protein [Paenibacillus oralis]|uniref:HEAT repeat domain-containing protein n=1 Tax=Paenibacillus oralis TaxID=2490856 RepID=A0A3P3U841_9BACL|nr:HEAT repeat domain-containing protein [Paenibacillus oralis]RRJ66521.1 HEAT repeat domain-containing protein [Paenibacillus oralis]
MAQHLTLAIYFIYVCLGLIGTGIALLFYLKIKQLRITRKTNMYLRKHQDYFTYIQTHLSSANSLRLPPGKLGRLEQRVIQQRVIEWIEQFRGDLQLKLIALCYDAGFVADDIKLLDSLFYGRRIAAAYRLGGMRAAEAVPRLLEMLKSQRYSPLSIVIARSIAKSAEQPEQLKDMLRYLLRHSKPIHHLAADIVMETRLDISRLLPELLEEQNKDLVKVALVAMWGQAVPEAAPALGRLVGAAEEDIRAEAVKLYLKASTEMKDETIRELMADKSAGVRAAVAKSLGSLQAAGSILLLRNALKDTNWQVRQNSAESLASLGETGFEVLCQIAKHGSGDEREAAMLQIEKTMRQQREHQRLDQMVDFNKMKLLYDRYFGASETRPVRQVTAVRGDSTA